MIGCTPHHGGHHRGHLKPPLGWGHHRGHPMPPMIGGCNLSLEISSKNVIFLQPITVNQLQTLISIYLHWFLLKIFGISMIFRGVGWSLVGSGSRRWVIQIQRIKALTEYKYIFTYSQCLYYLSNQMC